MAGIKILIVDDNAHARRLAREIISTIPGVEVRECADGRAAIEAARTWPTDLALVDYEMTPMDGVMFTELVRSGKTALRRDLPIAMMTGRADAAHVQRARKAGVNAFIAKPLSVGALLKHLQHLLSPPEPKRVDTPAPKVVDDSVML